MPSWRDTALGTCQRPFNNWYVFVFFSCLNNYRTKTIEHFHIVHFVWTMKESEFDGTTSARISISKRFSFINVPFFLSTGVLNTKEMPTNRTCLSLSLQGSETNLYQLYMCHFDNYVTAHLSKYPHGPHSHILFAAFTLLLFILRLFLTLLSVVTSDMNSSDKRNFERAD